MSQYVGVVAYLTKPLECTKVNNLIRKVLAEQFLKRERKTKPVRSGSKPDRTVLSI